MNRVDIQQELRQAQTDFHQLVAGATPPDLHRRSDSTRWTNRQLLWHMVFGYLIVRTLMPPVHLLGRLGWSRRFAAMLNVGQTASFRGEPTVQSVDSRVHDRGHPPGWQ